MDVRDLVYTFVYEASTFGFALLALMPNETTLESCLASPQRMYALTTHGSGAGVRCRRTQAGRCSCFCALQSGWEAAWCNPLVLGWMQVLAGASSDVLGREMDAAVDVSALDSGL